MNTKILRLLTQPRRPFLSASLQSKFTTHSCAGCIHLQELTSMLTTASLVGFSSCLLSRPARPQPRSQTLERWRNRLLRPWPGNISCCTDVPRRPIPQPDIIWTQPPVPRGQHGLGPLLHLLQGQHEHVFPSGVLKGNFWPSCCLDQ